MKQEKKPVETNTPKEIATIMAAGDAVIILRKSLSPLLLRSDGTYVEMSPLQSLVIDKWSTNGS